LIDNGPFDVVSRTMGVPLPIRMIEGVPSDLVADAHAAAVQFTGDRSEV